MGEKAIQYCRSYAFEAERKMGAMLRDAPKNAGARGAGISGVPARYSTLAELGLTKKERLRSRAQNGRDAEGCGEARHAA